MFSRGGSDFSWWMFDEFVQIGFGGLMMMAGFDFVVGSLLFLGDESGGFQVNWGALAGQNQWFLPDL